MVGPARVTIATDADAPPALEIDGLAVSYAVRGEERRVIRDLSLRVERGECYGLVGESGCGKSTAALAAVRYLPRNARIPAGRIRVDGHDVMQLDERSLRDLRTGGVAMVYQDPGRALNPSLRIGDQLAEIFELQGLGRREAHQRTADMLRRVRIVDPARVMRRYPHQISGGMQQRVVIAMALATNPRLLILDEPTTGLDTTVEAEILDLVASLRAESGTAILFISHNLAVIAGMCDRVGVLYGGLLVEEGPTRQVFENPRHPYTIGLLRCLPKRGQTKAHDRLDSIPGSLPAPGALIDGCIFADRCALADDRCRREAPALLDIGQGRLSRCHYHDRAPSLPHNAAEAGGIAAASTETPILSIDKLSKTFGNGRHALRALSDISLALNEGETLGLVGESGSGKTTLARILLGLIAPDAGSALALDGAPLAGRAGERSADQLRALQIVFQNPDSALNRAHSVQRLVGRALRKLGRVPADAFWERLVALTRAVRLPDRTLTLRPRQLSGGLKQRAAIARAFAGDPRIVVCDEPTSALDVSVQAALLNLLADLQRNRQTSYILISHDLGVVRYLADRIAVLYLGRLMEIGPAERIFAGPRHPYTDALLSAAPALDAGAATPVRLSGEMPSAIDPPRGCVFHTRCPRKLGPICEEQAPGPSMAGDGHEIRCHIPPALLLQEPRTH